jgi:hypothetical protein
MTQDRGRKAGGRILRQLARLLPAIVVLLVGCAPDDFGGNDPLLGGGPAVRPPGAAVAAGPARPPAATTAVPPLPPTTPAGTPAALASSGRGPLDATRPELHIGPDTATPAWGTKDGTAAGVALQPPQPLPGGGAVPLQPKSVPEVQLTGNTTAPTYEQLKKQLAAHGVTKINFTADAQTGETALTCWVPVPGNPTSNQRYDVKGRDPLSAMQAVLDEMDKKR